MDNQERKKLRWNELLLLLNKDPDWYKKSGTEHYKQIVTLGRQIFLQDQKNNLEKIDEVKFLTLVHYGYMLNQIAAEFNVSDQTLFCWRKSKGYIKKRKTEEVK